MPFETEPKILIFHPEKMNPSKDSQSVNARIYPACADDEIVITGIAGKFPNAKNVSELSQKLYNKVKQKNSKIPFFNKFSTQKLVLV